MDNRDVFVCRCEEITDADIRRVIKEGAKTLVEVKRATRAGMGLCQGRTCNKLIARILAVETGLQIEEVGVASYRAPLRPISINELSTINDNKVDNSLEED